MRLPPMPTSFIDEIEAMRIKKGDLIEFEGEVYTVRESGLKYCVCVLASNPKVERWIKHQQAYRWTPADEPQPDKKPLDLTQTFSHLGPRD